ncbi:MAG: translocation/assembly module TamB [bacterium]|nr:translocation/assembly module TamB [bacterium]
MSKLEQHISLRILAHSLNVAKWTFLSLLLIALGVVGIILSPLGQGKIAGILAGAVSSAGDGYCTIEAVQLHRFPTITVLGFRWAYKQEPVITCDSITIRVMIMPLFSKQVIAPTVKLAHLKYHLRQDSTGWNFGRLIKKKNPKPKSNIAARTGEFPLRRIVVGILEFNNSELIVDSRSPVINIPKSPFFVRIRSFVFVKNRMSFERVEVRLPQLAVGVSGRIDFSHNPPYGFANGDITLADSTVRRVLHYWPETPHVALDFDGSHSPGGLHARAGVYLPGQAVNVTANNLDGNLHIIGLDVTTENFDLSPFVTGIDSTAITANITGEVRDPFSDISFAGKLLVDSSSLPPLENLTADLQWKFNKKYASAKGKIGERHANLTVDVSTVNFLKDNAQAKLTAHGSLLKLRDFLKSSDFPDSIFVNLVSNTTGKQIPIDSVAFRLSTSRLQLYKNVVDTLFAAGGYHRNRITLDTVRATSAGARIALSGEATTYGAYDVKGTIDHLFVDRVPQVFSVDTSIAATASVQFDAKGSAGSDSAKASHQVTFSGLLENVVYQDFFADSILVTEAVLNFPDSPYLIALRIDSLRSKYSLPVSLEVHGSWKRDSILLSLHTVSDTLSVDFTAAAKLDTLRGILTTQIDTLQIRNRNFPITLMQSAPIEATRRGIRWERYQADTPLGIVNGSFRYDTSGTFGGGYAISQMALTSLLTVVPKLRDLQGEISVDGNWLIRKNHPPTVTGYCNILGAGWNNVYVLDTLEAQFAMEDYLLSWDMNGRRDGIQALSSSGIARLTDTSFVGFDSLTLETIEMPSQWFVGMLPRRSVWDGTIKANVQRDQTNGIKLFVDLTGKRFVMPEFGIDQRDLVIRASTIGNALVIQQAETKSGKGNFKLTGQIAYDDSFTVDIQARARDFRFLKQPRKQISGDLDFSLHGPLNHLMMTGRSRISEAVFDMGEEEKDLEEVYLEDEDGGVFPALSIWNNAEGSISADAQGNVWIRGRGVNAEARMNLVMFKETGQQYPQIYGNVEILRGYVVQYGKRLTITSGSLTFDGPPFDPRMNITAVEKSLKRTKGVDITLSISGTAQNPELILSGKKGETQLSEFAAIGYLTIGMPLDENNLNITNETSELAKSGAIEQVTGLVGQRLGLSVFEYRSAKDSTTRKSSDTLEIGGYVTDKLFFSVATPVSTGVNKNTIRAEYQLLPWLRLATERDGEGKQTIEAYIQTEWDTPPIRKQSTVTTPTDSVKKVKGIETP